MTTSASCSTAATGPRPSRPTRRIANAPILGITLGVENTYGAMEGRTPAGPLTYARFTTDDTAGVIRGYVGEGTTTDDELNTFGHRAVAQVPRLQELLQYICDNGFEHHVAVNASHTGEVLAEACGKYLGWDMHHAPMSDNSPIARTRSQIAATIAGEMLEIIKHAGAGHTGGSLSCTGHSECALQPRAARLAGDVRLDPNRDRYIQSKGHSVEALLRRAGGSRVFRRCGTRNALPISTRRLSGIRRARCRASSRTPGRWGMACRSAWARRSPAKKDKRDFRVFVLMGDGELAEGSNWEAAMAAAHYELDNLIAIVDHNTLQITGRTRDVCSNEPLDEKFRAFGWDVRPVDGHSIRRSSLTRLSPHRQAGKPLCVIANTIKGKGVSFMEDVAKWHHGVPSDEEYRQGPRRTRSRDRRSWKERRR